MNSLPMIRWLASYSWRALTTFDVFPDFSARVRRLLYNPFGVLLFADLASLLCGLFLYSHVLMISAGITTVIGLGILWPWMTLRGLQGSLSFDRLRANEGEAVEARLTVRSVLFWAAWGLIVHGGFCVNIGNEAPPVASIASAPRRRTICCRWLFTPACRGVYPLGISSLATAFPFGIWQFSRPIAAKSPLIVWPKTFPVGPVPLVSGDRQIEGNVSRNKVGTNGDVLGVRPYRRGDSPRRIHWAQSARHDRLIVCEVQSNARPVIQLVLDTDRAVHAGEGPDCSREWAIRIVASLARGWLEAGAQVGAVWNDEAFQPASGEKQTNRILDSLAKLSDQPGPTLVETLSNAACREFREGLQVIITTDQALAARSESQAPGHQHWIVLRASAFGACVETAVHSPIVPWLLIDHIEQIPAMLRGAWKEAQHGN